MTEDRWKTKEQVQTIEELREELRKEMEEKE